MAMGDAFFNCNGSSAFCTREAFGPINLVIWNMEVLDMSLRAEPHLYVALAAVY
jgi:hypothetical protein